MKLIEMEKVLSELCLSHKDIIYIDKNETAERIRKIPSIDIVRCKECKYWDDTIPNEIYCSLLEGLCDISGDSFCSYGVRKTNTTAEEKPTPIRDYMVHGEREGE